MMLKLKKKQIICIMLFSCLISLHLTEECGLSDRHYQEVVYGVILAVFLFSISILVMMYSNIASKKKHNEIVLGVSLFGLCCMAVAFILSISDFYLKMCIGEGIGFGIITSCLLLKNRERITTKDTKSTKK